MSEPFAGATLPSIEVLGLVSQNQRDCGERTPPPRGFAVSHVETSSFVRLLARPSNTFVAIWTYEAISLLKTWVSAHTVVDVPVYPAAFRECRFVWR